MGRSKELNELIKLRENLDKKSKNAPDYHITSNKDYHIHRKVTVDSEPSKKKKSKKKSNKPVATEKIKYQIKELFRYGFDVPRNAQLSVSSNINQRYQNFKFNDEFQLADTLTEFSRGAKVIVFIVDDYRDTIYWDNYGTREVRVIRQ